MSALRASVLGGVDGIITSFAIAAGAHAAGFSMDVVFVIGTSSLLADGLSMGISEYISSSGARAERMKDGTLQKWDTRPLSLGLSCFTSFVTCGSVPVATYLLTHGNLLSCAMFSIACLMLLGSARTSLSGEPLLLGFAQTTILGSAAGGVAYGVGTLMHSL
jgi:VIT1/CCC1 family predicted Fe2+/Mn2+ transporter